ncbi:MAG: ATP-binding protein [Magnetococcales bacterium]|nr:ATP-binding protein [Magnetococcales bacterium]
MLKKLGLLHVGPAPEMSLELSPRLNLITGDNGLGKTFLLVAAWWALTRSWASEPATPDRSTHQNSSIEWTTSILSEDSPVEKEIGSHSSFDTATNDWSYKGQPASHLALYSLADGSFASYEPVKALTPGSFGAMQATRPALPFFKFSPRQLLDGLKDPSTGTMVCEGLIAHLNQWSLRRSKEYDHFISVLEALSPPDLPLTLGAPLKISLDDDRDYPTIRMPYGQDVPIVHVSAGVRRIVSLAYLLVWTWHSHQRAAKLVQRPPIREVVFLVDEMETHLHPQWQRRIVPALLNVVKSMTGQSDIRAQLIATTHSPLILASVEPEFDEEQDALFHLKLREGGGVALDKMPWAKQGDASHWLVSDAFGLRQARSVQAEEAISAANAWMRGEREGFPPGLDDAEAIHQELLKVLPDLDPFWPRWIVRREKSGGAA